MGSGGSSRRKDTDDGDYDSDQDQFDQDDTYDDSEMKKQENRQRASEVLKAIRSREFIVTSPKILNKLISEQGIHLSRQASLDLLQDLSANETGLVDQALEAHAESDVSPEIREKLKREFQRELLLKNAKKRARSY